MATYTIEGPVCHDGTRPSLLLPRTAAGKWSSAWGLHPIHRVFPTTIVPYMINSRRHYCRSNCIAFRELDSFAQDVSEVHKRSLMFNTRWKTAEGLPTKNGSSARIWSTSGDIVAARWQRAWWRRALRARAISKWACQEQFDNNQRLSFGAKPPRPSHLAPKYQELAFACANQRLMASPLRQTSHSAMHRGFLPPFFFCGCWCNFFHRPLLLSGSSGTTKKRVTGYSMYSFQPYFLLHALRFCVSRTFTFR